MTDEERIRRRLEYLDYIENAVKDKPSKFKDWVLHTVVSLNNFHTNLHKKIKSLKNILKEEPNGA